MSTLILSVLSETLFFLLQIHSLVAYPNTRNISTCHNKCGNIPIRYPLGSGFGCGHPDFAPYISCNHGTTLQFTTTTNGLIYTISSIDYSSNTIFVTDPLMSTCSSMQNSGSFILNDTTPFILTPNNMFVLLGCSRTSPLYDKNQDLCDTGSGLNLCRGLYSCNAVIGIGLEPKGPISTCCVYELPGMVYGDYGLDLPKLQCSSYSSIYGFGGNEGDPMKWEYGLSLQFNGSYDNEGCKNCEESGGICGFFDKSFVCVCQNGVNTTINCYGRGSGWSKTWRHNIHVELSIGEVYWCDGWLACSGLCTSMKTCCL